MPETSSKQRKIIGRVMHEFEHGELESGPEGKAGPVKSRKQAIAIALNEAGASKYQSQERKRKSLAESERKQAEGRTYQQQAEGKSRVDASGRRESWPAMGGEDPEGPTTGGATRQALYARARAKGIEGRSKMSKQQLANALER